MGSVIDIKGSDLKESAELDAVADHLAGFMQPNEAVSCAVARLRKLAGV